ncbi:MAG: Helix-turn-helix domain protein [Pelotomaculum sp. PtaU1.Bin035]|nr:MAG: Helix-turn-helix domain protein [Pelotomaculum sp. PtaU1.Bin035]
MSKIVNWEQLPIVLTPEIVWEKKILPLGKRGIYELCHSEGFPTVKAGKKFLISRDGLRRWVERN